MAIAETPVMTKQALLDALIGANSVRMRALDSTHGYVSGTSEFLDDIVAGSYLGDEEILASVTTTDGYLRADVATLTSILTNEFVDALVIYIWTGSAATSRILVFVDKNADNSDMNREGVTGQTIQAYPPDYILRI